MCCWNSLQHAYNYNSWFSISPWENNHCSMKDEWCPSPMSPKTHVQTDSALSGLCPVSKYRCRRSEMFTHVHLEETYMLLFTDPLPLRVSLWSTITGKRCTLAAEVTESRWRSLWTRAAEAHRGLTDPTSGRFVTPLKTLSTGMETCSKSGPRANWNVAVRTCRATVPAAGQRAERQRYWDQIPLLLPPSQIRYFGAASTESNRSRGRYRCGEERVTVAKRGLRWPTGRRIAPTRERKGTKSIVIPGCLLSSHGSGKIRATTDSKPRQRRSCWSLHGLLVTRNEARTATKIAIIADIGAPALAQASSTRKQRCEISSWARTRVRKSQW